MNYTQNSTTRTANGMRANKSSLSTNVDFFFAAGASRGKDLTKQFSAAYREDPDVAVRILQWARDVRGGAGERSVFRLILTSLANGSTEYRNIASALIPKIPEIGRWDDLLVLMGTKLEADAAYFIGEAIGQRHALAAKWMPRKGPHSVTLRRYWGLNPKEYRKVLVSTTNVVETAMCAKQWDTIDFGKLPSLAAARYQKAFSRNATKAYELYKARLENGTDTINAGAVFPYDVLKSVVSGDASVADAQWAALPDYMQGSTERLIAVADVSGSMGQKVGGNPNLSCMDVCISLSMYVAERGRGAFKDAFITFSEQPKLQLLTGKTLKDRYSQLKRADWGMSTNLHSVFNQILRVAKRDSVPETDMPTTIIIFSDMQFNACIRNDDTAIKTIQREYAAAGYTIPTVVFWNLNAVAGTSPATINDKGVALVSGCSPAILKSILGGKDFSPEGIMLDAIRDTRYDWQ